MGRVAAFAAWRSNNFFVVEIERGQRPRCNAVYTCICTGRVARTRTCCTAASYACWCYRLHWLLVFGYHCCYANFGWRLRSARGWAGLSQPVSSVPPTHAHAQYNARPICRLLALEKSEDRNIDVDDLRFALLRCALAPALFAPVDSRLPIQRSSRASCIMFLRPEPEPRFR
jgi:hypothetical protein